MKTLHKYKYIKNNFHYVIAKYSAVKLHCQSIKSQNLGQPMADFGQPLCADQN